MNALSEYINFERNNINNFAKETLSEYYDEELFNKLLNIYVNARYYNYENYPGNGLSDAILKDLKGELSKLIIGVEKETKKKLKEMYMIFYYVMMYDDVISITDKKLVNVLSTYRNELFGENDILFKGEIAKFIEGSNNKRKQFVNFFRSEDFSIKRRGTSNEHVFDITLKHKIDFPKIYSEYAVDRVFNTGNINEDKLEVLYYMISGIIIKDIKKCIFNNYYLIEFAPSLLNNKEKFSKIMEVIDNDLFRSQTYFKISFDDYSNFAGSIKDLIKAGYKFVIECEDEDLEEDNFVLSSIFDYIVVNKNSKYLSEGNKNIIFIK